MTERATPRIVVPFADNIDDGGPHLAATDVGLSQGTQGLVRRSAGNFATLAYYAPFYQADLDSAALPLAPFADLTNTVTWESFTCGGSGGIGGAPLEIPWYVSDGHDYPVARIRAVTDTRYLNFEMRVQKKTFVSATSTETFDAPAPLMPFYNERANDYAYAVWEKGTGSFFNASIECSGISLPAAPRDILIEPQIRISQRGISGLGDVSGTHRVYLSQIMLYDEWDP